MGTFSSLSNGCVNQVGETMKPNARQWTSADGCSFCGQRDMAERGHSLESIKASIESRKPDFDAFIGKAFSIQSICSQVFLFLM